MMVENSHGLSVVIPAYNEEAGITRTLEELKEALSVLEIPWEIIVVNDGSSDRTREIVAQDKEVRLLDHPTNVGYGRSLKTGIFQCQYEWVGIIDADGTYPASEFPRLVNKMDQGFDMVIAARSNTEDHDSVIKAVSRKIYKTMVNILCGHRIKDPNSGLRIFKRCLALEFIEFLCDRFSFTTSLSVLSMMKPYFVCFEEIDYNSRAGTSHVRHIRDSLTTMMVLIQGVTYFNPIRFFCIMAIAMIFLIGFPAMCIAMLEMFTLSAYYMVFGCTVSLLFALGVIGEIIRVSSTRKEFNLHKDTRSNSTQ